MGNRRKRKLLSWSNDTDMEYTVLTSEMALQISRQMVQAVTSNEELDYKDFCCWLDLNPAIRAIIYQALKPAIWSSNDSEFDYVELVGDYLKIVDAQTKTIEMVQLVCDDAIEGIIDS